VTDPQRVSEHYANVLSRPEYQQNVEVDYLGQISNWVISFLASLNESMGDFQYAPQIVGLSYIVMWLILLFTGLALVYWIAKWLRHYRAPDIPLREHPEGKRYFATPESFEPQIQEALAMRDWPGALKARWMQFLALMEKHGLVNADRTRTNWEYLAQLERQSHIPPQACELSRSLAVDYDLYIYGGRALPETRWKEWSQALDRASRLLKLSRLPTGVRQERT
jgi:hypothetical protein